MKYQLSVIGCDKEYGEERVILEDEQVGTLTMREIELDSLEDVHDLLDETDTVQFGNSRWNRYDGKVTIICGDLF